MKTAPSIIGPGAAVFLSGAAGLAYQLAWVRRIAAGASATVAAQAIVLSVFMCGLGLGSAWASRRAPSSRRPLLDYAVVEMAALAFALSSTAILPHAGLLGAALYLLLPATLLGASLPLVIEEEERKKRDKRTIAALYAINTVGAAVGALAAGFWGIERLGLKGTIAAGALCSFAAAAIAFVRAEPATPERTAEKDAHPGAPIEARLVLAATITGFIGLAAEVLWSRMFALILPNTVYAFALVLAGVLAGIALGAALARQVARFGDPVRIAGALLVFGAVTLALIPLDVLHFAGARMVQLEIASGASVFGAMSVIGAVLLPATSIAALLPLLSMSAAKVSGARAFGALYAWNTAGAMAGSAAAGFVLLPGIGIRGAETVLEIAALLLALVLLWGQKRAGLLVALGAAASLLLGLSQQIPLDIHQKKLGPDVAILAYQEGAESDVMVTEEPSGRRLLWINGSWVATAGGGTGMGHRMLGHIPALLHPHPRTALGIALGTGQTFHALLEHGVVHLDCVEINPGVIDLSRRFFREHNRGLLDDPRVEIHADDGRAFLRRTESSFDMIALEPLQAWSAGTSNLYSREFYEEASARLGKDGLLVQWIPFYGQGVDETRSMVKTGLEVFGHGTLWSVSGFDAILVLAKHEQSIDPLGLMARARARRLDGEMGALGFATGADVSSLFLAGTAGLRRWTEGAEVLGDDRPSLEYRAARSMARRGADALRGSFVEILRSLEPALESPSVYATTATGAALLADVPAVRKAVLNSWTVGEHDFEGAARAIEAGLERVPRSSILRAHLRERVTEWVKTTPPADRSLAFLERSLGHAFDLDPSFREAALELARAEAKEGRLDRARQLIERAGASPATSTTADPERPR